MIKFSVIIPNYNHAPFLNQRIDSVLEQTYANFEVIILDDASTDNSREIIESYRNHPKISHVLYNEINSGSPFRQWKKGIERARGEWVWIAESDDIATPGFLSEGLGLISRNHSVNLFYCDAELYGDKNRDRISKKYADLKNTLFETTKWSADYIAKGTDEIEECLGISCTINNASSVLLKRGVLADILHKLGDFRFHGDWFCYLYLASKGDIAYLAKQLNIHRDFSSGVRSDLPESGKNKQECFRILEFIYFQLPLHDKRSLLRKFVHLQLDGGLIRERKEWLGYFSINKKLARKVLFEMIRKRILPGKFRKP